MKKQKRMDILWTRPEALPCQADSPPTASSWLISFTLTIVSHNWEMVEALEPSEIQGAKLVFLIHLAPTPGVYPKLIKLIQQTLSELFCIIKLFRTSWS